MELENELVNAIRELAEQMKKRFDEMDKRFEEFNKRFAEMEMAVGSLEGRAKSTEKQMDILQSKTLDANAQLVKMEVLMNSHSRKLEFMADEVTRFRKDFIRKLY